MLTGPPKTFPSSSIPMGLSPCLGSPSTVWMFKVSHFYTMTHNHKMLHLKKCNVVDVNYLS